MSYYMGDFYRGDPGIGSFFSGLVKKAVGFIPGVGPIASAVAGAVLPGGAKAIAARVPAAASVTAAARNAAGAITSAVVKHPVMSAAGAAGALAVGAADVGMHMGAARAMGGKRVLKHCHVPLKSGRLGKCHRSMNVCNPRALRRAIRRTRGFAKLAMRTIHIVHPKKKGRFGGFKKRKRG